MSVERSSEIPACSDLLRVARKKLLDFFFKYDFLFKTNLIIELNRLIDATAQTFSYI